MFKYLILIRTIKLIESEELKKFSSTNAIKCLNKSIFLWLCKRINLTNLELSELVSFQLNQLRTGNFVLALESDYKVNQYLKINSNRLDSITKSYLSLYGLNYYNDYFDKAITGLQNEISRIVKFPIVSKFNKYDSRFKLINSKSVCIIGPGIINVSEIKRLKSYDLICYLNEPDKKLVDNLSNVPYIIYLADYVVDKVVNGHYKELGWIRSASLIGTRTKNRVFENLYKHTYFACSNYYYINGAMNLGILAIWDILLFSPDKIEVLGFDLWTRNKLYRNSSYVGNLYWKNKSDVVLNVFSKHNIIYSYHFLNYIVKCNKIRTSRSLKNILNSGVNSYIKKLSKTLDL